MSAQDPQNKPDALGKTTPYTPASRAASQPGAARAPSAPAVAAAADPAAVGGTGGEAPFPLTDSYVANPDAPVDLAVICHPGMQVGEYVVEKKIGEGGMGSVFSAKHPIIGKRVAIKVISPAYASEPEAIERFIREARSVNEIGHQNIIDIFAFGKLPMGLNYFVMEFLDGRSLQDELTRIGHPCSADEMMSYLRPVFSALSAAHAKGITHRDLKPENIYVIDRAGGPVIKVIDFGLAKLAGEGGVGFKTRTGVPMGTPYYMAPEQCLGKSIDHRADIYAMGVIMYQMMTSRLPFYAESYLEVLQQQLSAQPVRPSELVSGMAAHVEAAILWAMQKDPAQRPQTIQEVWNAIDGREDQRVSIPTPMPVAAPGGANAPGAPSYFAQPGVTPFAGIGPKKSKMPIAIGGGIAALAAVVAVVLVMKGGSQPAPAQPAAAVQPASAPKTPEPPAAEPAKPAAPTTGTLRIELEPADALLAVDNVAIMGGADVTLPPGPHKIRAAKSGFKPREEEVTLAVGDRVVMRVSLDRAAKAASSSSAPAKPKSQKLRDKDDTARPSWAD